MALITVAFLEARLGYSVDATQAAALIDDVSAIVVDYVNDADTTDAWDETTTPAAVQAVVAQMVQRGIKNPLARTGENLGDHGWQAPMGASGLYLAPKERKILLPSFQSQSAWMASKSIASYVGSCIVEFGEEMRGISPSIQVEWLLERVPRENDWPGAR
jgi:hypothetical protein